MMKKCMTCGYDNQASASTCLICNETLTAGFSKADDIGMMECSHCRYPMLDSVTYRNCPYCSKVFGENEKAITEAEPGGDESINVRIIIDTVLLGELRIHKGKLVFVNSKDYQYKKALKIQGPVNGEEKRLKYNKSYGKRTIGDMVEIGSRDLIELSTKEDKVLIQIDFK